MDFPGGNSDENVNFLNKDSCQNVLSEIQVIHCLQFFNSKGALPPGGKNIEGVS